MAPHKEGNMSYCTGCIYRKERWKRGKGGWDFVNIPDTEFLVTNKKGFCFIGYTQNPLTQEATQNTLRNKAEVCPKNPWRARI